MKTNILMATIAMMLLACQPKSDLDKEPELDMAQIDLTPPLLDMSMTDKQYEIKAPSPNMPPPIQTVKFVPPNIKDDEVDEPTAPSASNAHTSKNKKIIKDGSIIIKVKEVEVAKKQIDALLKTFGAYYENEHFVNYETRTSYELKIRVPSKQFEAFLKASEHSTGEIITKNISARDVTEEYEDSETRLENKRLFRTRYNQLLEKALKVEDILAIEENIHTLQEEIESQEGHLKYLADQVSYSTLDITLFKEKIPTKIEVTQETFASRIKASLTGGWNMLMGGVIWVVIQWPWYLGIILLVIVIKVIRKRRKK
jgi:hypothetical protein